MDGSVTYHGVGNDNTVWLDVGDIGAQLDLCDGDIVERSRVSLQLGKVEGVLETGAVAALSGLKILSEGLVLGELGGRDGVLEDNDVLARNDISSGGARNDGWSAKDGGDDGKSRDELLVELHGRQIKRRLVDEIKILIY